MAELAKAKKLRVAAKGWVTRSVTQTSKLFDESQLKQGVSSEELESVLDEFNARLSALHDAQTAVEVCLEEDEIERDIEVEAEFLERAQKFRGKLAKAIKDLLKSEQAHSETSATHAQQNVRLPKLDLPKYSGKPEDWLHFWETFVANVDAQDIPEVTKFSYLLSCLVGEAKRAVAGMEFSAGNYAHHVRS